MKAGDDTQLSASLWHYRDFVALWSGQVISVLGSRITATALPLLVLALTHSPAAAGMVVAAGSLPYLLLHLPAGTLVDRWRRRRIMLTAQLVAAAALSSVPLVLWAGTLTVVQLIVVAFVEGVCFVFFGLAERASIPRIVPVALLPAAIAQNEAKTRGAALAGPPLGGLLFGVGRAVPFLTDAISYLVGAFTVWLVRGDLQPAKSPQRSTLWRETAAGLVWLWRERFIRAAVLLVAASNMLFQAIFLVLIVLASDRGASAPAIGLMLGIFGGGGLAGAFVAARLHHVFAPRTVVVGVNWVWAALFPLLALPVHPLVLGAIGAAAAFIGPLWNVVIGTYQMTLIPNELMGRVNSAAMTLSWGVLPLGSLAAGYLIQGVGPVGAVWTVAGAMLLIAIAATASPSVRRATRRTDADRT